MPRDLLYRYLDIDLRFDVAVMSSDEMKKMNGAVADAGDDVNTVHSGINSHVEPHRTENIATDGD